MNTGIQGSATANAEQRTSQLSRPNSQAQYTFQAGHEGSIPFARSTFARSTFARSTEIRWSQPG
jgi:hypothetical protein